MIRTALALVVLLATSAHAQERSPIVALEGATVHTVSGETAKATVLISGGRILAIGQAPAPAGSQRVDLTGKHLYPGLIDAHTVLGLVEVSSVAGTNDQTEVGPLNPNLRGEVGVNPDSELLPVARTGGVLLALTGANSGLIAGTSALIATEGRTWEAMTVRAPVFMRVRWPRMRIDRSRGSGSEPEKQLKKREKALQSLDEAFHTARAYWQARKSATAPHSDQDVKWDALGPVLRGALPVSVEAQTLAQISSALDWARRERLQIVLVGGADAALIADRLKAQRVPVILGSVFRMPRRNYEAVHTPFETAALLHAAGVEIAFSTGANGFAASNARNLRDHAAMAVGSGLPEDAAVYALTLGAAKIIGVDDRLGSIEVGKQATLIATSGPLFDFRTGVTHAWIDGRSVSLEDRQRRLYERYR